MIGRTWWLVNPNKKQTSIKNEQKNHKINLRNDVRHRMNGLEQVEETYTLDKQNLDILTVERVRNIIPNTLRVKLKEMLQDNQIIKNLNFCVKLSKLRGRFKSFRGCYFKKRG